MKWLVLLATLGGCLAAPDEPYGFTYEWSKVWNGPSPGPMHGAKLTYDRGPRNAIVMYAGRNINVAGGAPSGTVWMWKDGKWTEICKNPDPATNKMPTPVYLPGFVYAEGAKTLVLAGGARIAPSQPQLFGDISDEVWACDATDTWHMLGKLANARAGASLVYVRDYHELRLIGGRDQFRQFQNVEIADASWTAAMPSGMGFHIDPDQDMPFYSAGSGQSATFDTNEGQVIALATELTPDESIVKHDEIWAYDGTWKPRCKSCSGVGRSDASIVHVEASAETYVLGGYVGGGINVAGSWIFDSNQLVKIDSGIGQRNGVGVASTNDDPNANALITFGGTAPSADCPGYECDDSFEYHIPR